MKHWWKGAMAVVALSLSSVGVKAGQPTVLPVTKYAVAEDKKVDAKPVVVFDDEHEDCGRGGIFAEIEAGYFKFFKADGVRVGVESREGAEFDFEWTPRLTIGYLGSSGLGVRLRYWEFNQDGKVDEDPEDFFAVDTHTIDAELFGIFHPAKNWTIEVAGGLRQSDYQEIQNDEDAGEFRFHSFSGWGGIASAKVSCNLCSGLAPYAQVRGAWLVGDATIGNNEGGGGEGGGSPDAQLNDTTRGMLELQLGVEYQRELRNGMLLVVKGAGEWQNWYNFSSSFEDTQNTEDFGGPSDIGFAGFVFGIGIRR